MKAAVLNAFGAPLAIQTLPDPVIGTGEVIVDVVAGDQALIIAAAEGQIDMVLDFLPREASALASAGGHPRREPRLPGGADGGRQV